MERVGNGDDHAGESENQGAEMKFEVASGDDGTATVTVEGELDISNVERLEQAAEPIIEAKPNRLVVDLRGLRFADSSAIAVWVRWASVVGEIELRNPSPLLREVITKMGLAGTLRLQQ
jgi:anti-anti-sigma factor